MSTGSHRCSPECSFIRCTRRNLASTWIRLVYSLEADLNTDAFNQAWKFLTARHNVLRTSFHWEEVEEPLQVVHKHAPLILQRLDWSDVSDIEQQANLADLLQHDRAAGIDLSQPPLMRITLVRIGLHSWRMLLTYHHLLLDRWSVSLVLSELRAVYSAYL